MLERPHKYNIHLKTANCEFLKREIDAKGLHSVDEKVDAVKRAPVPQNVKELRSFFGHGPILPPIFTGFNNHTSTIT